MEKTDHLPQNPLEFNLVNRVDEGSFTIEPEMEDFTDPVLLKNLAEELGIDQDWVEYVNPLKHDDRMGVDCVHCKILKKISGLQLEILKMNQEIGATNDILKLKQDQNSDLKGMICRLEENLGNAKSDEVVDKSSETCSCINKCVVS